MQRDDATSDDATPECNADIHVPGEKLFSQTAVGSALIDELADLLPDLPTRTLHEINCSERGVNVCNVGGWKSAGDLGHHEINRVALPGDVDYVGFWTG